MSLRQTISEAQIAALKSHEEKKLAILRVLSAAIKNVEIDKHRELNDEEIQAVVTTQVKQLADALKDFVNANRQDLVEKTNLELNLLKAYLPVQLDDNELSSIVDKVLTESGAKSAADLGRLTGLVMKEVKGKADGNRVKEAIAKRLPA